jgi:hypothetical protein
LPAADFSLSGLTVSIRIDDHQHSQVLIGWLALAHAALDERDAAFAWFEKAFAEHDPWIIWFGTDPKLKSLRDDPRAVELFRRTGNPLSRR